MAHGEGKHQSMHARILRRRVEIKWWDGGYGGESGRHRGEEKWRWDGGGSKHKFLEVGL